MCCTEGQVDDLLTSFMQAEAILGRCPTCYYNFRVNFCDMTCAPTQGEFLKPLKVVNGTKASDDKCGGGDSDGRPDVQRKLLILMHSFRYLKQELGIVSLYFDSEMTQFYMNVFLKHIRNT